MEAGLIQGCEWLVKPVGSTTIFTPEMFTPEQREIHNTAAKFAREKVAPLLEHLEHADDETKRRLNAELLRKAAEVGLLMLGIPEEYGGLPSDETTALLVSEAMSFEGSNFASTFGAHTGIGTLPILFFGTEDQKQRYLPKLASGELLSCYCLTEENSGSDALAAKTRAVLSKDGKHYVLTGTKQFITNGGFADIAIVFAKIDGTAFTGFIVRKDADGISVGPEEKKMGLKSNSTCQVILENCKVPVEDRLGEPGRGHKIAFNTLNIGRAKLGAGATGGCKRALRMAIGYGKERKQFGKPLVEFTMIREKIAEMYIRAYASEAVTYRTGGLWDLSIARVERNDFPAVAQAIEEYTVEASIAKILGSESLAFCVDEGLQIHGGYGYIAEYAIERAYRDARINRIFEGTNEINRMIIPGTLGKKAMRGQLPLQERVERVGEELSAGKLPADDGSPLGVAKMQVEKIKRIAVAAAQASMMKHLQAIGEEQELLRLLADMMIFAFAADSVVARVAQKIADRGEGRSKVQIAAARVYAADAHRACAGIAWDLFCASFAGEELEAHLLNLSLLSAATPVNTVALRREVADAVIESGEYAG